MRFHKKNRQITFECWPRFASVDDGDAVQYAGWPITIGYRDNDGRKLVGHLPELIFADGLRPVIQVISKNTSWKLMPRINV